MADQHRQGNLSLSAGRDLTCLAVTCANIISSVRSSVGYPFTFIAERNALLPLAHFTEEPIFIFLKIKIGEKNLIPRVNFYAQFTTLPVLVREQEIFLSDNILVLPCF